MSGAGMDLAGLRHVRSSSGVLPSYESLEGAAEREPYTFDDRCPCHSHWSRASTPEDPRPLSKVVLCRSWSLSYTCPIRQRCALRLTRNRHRTILQVSISESPYQIFALRTHIDAGAGTAWLRRFGWECSARLPRFSPA